MAPQYEIINDNEIYRNRKYSHYGYYTEINDEIFRGYFPKIRFEDVRLEDYISSIENIQVYSNQYFVSLILEDASEFNRNNEMGWDLPIKENVGSWKNHKIDKPNVVSTLSNIVLRNIMLKNGLVLFKSEVGSIGEYIYDVILSDTIVNFRPMKARLIFRIKNFNQAIILKFFCDCIDNVLVIGEDDIDKGCSEVFNFCKSILPLAKEYSETNPISPLGLRIFIEQNFPKIWENYNDLQIYINELEKDLNWALRAIAFLYIDLFTGSVSSWNTLSCCRVWSSIKFRKKLKLRGFKTPSIFEMNEDRAEYLRSERIWYAGMKNELEWQTNKLLNLIS